MTVSNSCAAVPLGAPTASVAPPTTLAQSPTSHPARSAGQGTPTGAAYTGGRVSCPADGTVSDDAHASPSAPTSAGHTHRRLNLGHFTIGHCA